MKDLFVVQTCLHCVNKSGRVRGEERTRGLKTFLMLCFLLRGEGARWVRFATKENRMGARYFNTNTGRYSNGPEVM